MKAYAATIILAAGLGCSRPPQQVVFVPATPGNPVPTSPTGNSDQVYFEFQVTRTVAPTAGMVGPKYPVDLRAAGTEGEVLVQFVVDTLGRPEMHTFKVLRSSHGEFTRAVRDAVAGFTLTPAELN